jgi:UDP-N-acetylglucosamine transferase subunit ALG13
MLKGGFHNTTGANMNKIIIREYNSKYQVFDGDLLLACFASRSKAQEYADRSSLLQTVAGKGGI